MALADGRVHAGISDLSRPENRFERTERKLLDVYMPVETAGGEPLLFSQEASVQAETRPRGP